MTIDNCKSKVPKIQKSSNAKLLVAIFITVVRVEVRCHKWAKEVKSHSPSHGELKIETTGWPEKKVD